jgi:hypothetical protein
VLSSSHRSFGIIYVNERNLAWIRQFAQHLQHQHLRVSGNWNVPRYDRTENEPFFGIPIPRVYCITYNNFDDIPHMPSTQHLDMCGCDSKIPSLPEVQSLSIWLTQQEIPNSMVGSLPQQIRHLRIIYGVCKELPWLPNLETLVTSYEPDPLLLLTRFPSLKTLAVRLADEDICTMVQRFKPLHLDLLFVSFHDGPMSDSCVTFKKHLMLAEHQFTNEKELWQAVVFKS